VNRLIPLIESRRANGLARAVLIVAFCLQFVLAVNCLLLADLPAAGYALLGGAVICLITASLLLDARHKYLRTPIAGFIVAFGVGVSGEQHYISPDPVKVAEELEQLLDYYRTTDLICRLSVCNPRDEREIHCFRVPTLAFRDLLARRATNYQLPDRQLW
jgi:hypothetical protein